MDLQEEIGKRTAEYIGSEKFNANIQATIEKTINEVVSEMFRYGPVKDAISAGIKEKISIDLGQIEFVEINQIITDIVKKKCRAAFHEPLLEKLTESLSDMFEPAKKEVTLQDIVDIWKEQLRDECSCADPEQELLVEIDREKGAKGWTTVKMWNDGKKERKDTYLSSSSKIPPDLHIYVRDDGRIAIIHHLKEEAIRNLGTSFYDADAKLFMMYCAGTKIVDIAEVDAYDLNKRINDHIDY